MDEQQGVLKKRWDNVEHFPDLPNFPHHVYIARIIHQPEKSTMEDSMVTKVNLKTAISQDHSGPKTRASACRGIRQTGRMVAMGRTSLRAPSRASPNRFVLEPLELRASSPGLFGQTYACQQGQTAPQYRRHRARCGQRYRDARRQLLHTGIELAQAPLDRLHGCGGPWGGPSHRAAPGIE
jgi:hypothetical protein